MTERLTKCPLCKSAHFLNDMDIKDQAVSKEVFIISRCTDCHLLFTNPRPTLDTIGIYYDYPEYFSHEDKSKGLTPWIYQKIRNYTIKNKIDLIEDYKEIGKLLDYGCGTGELLKEARKNLWKVTGIEPNDKARNYANKKLNGKVYKSIKNLDQESSYDVITLFHVLEHIHDLRSTIKDILNHLKKTGYLIIAVPNHESYEAKQYKEYWAGWDVPRHLYHFNEKSIEYFSKEFNLVLKEIKPMFFDSYYVSLLSEKYKKPNSSMLSQYINAFKNGLISNQKAKKPGEYSSNIYIFKKNNEK